MKRPDYINHYLFDWDALNVILGGKSALDSNSFGASLDHLDDIHNFLAAYGFDQSDTVLRAEIFGTFQESLQFIKRYFLKTGNKGGLDLVIPQPILAIEGIAELIEMAIWIKRDAHTYEESLWAQIVLKVMHTILHVDKDLRHNYFSQIQQQIFDRFYKFFSRDREGNLYLGNRTDTERVFLRDFQTKAKKERDSIIIKLLRKKENIAEELFDRIGVRFVTATRLDCLRVVKFLYKNNVVIIYNVKPSRSRNSLIDLDLLKRSHYTVLQEALREGIGEEEFQEKLNQKIVNPPWNVDENIHSSRSYRSIQFTAYHLIKYQDPFGSEFVKLKNRAREVLNEREDQLAEQIIKMYQSFVAQNISFFYPFEVQLMDLESQENNMEGSASHQKYKESQLKAAMYRLFAPLVKYKNIKLPSDILQHESTGGNEL